MSEPIDAAITAMSSVQGLSGKVFHSEALKNAAAPFVFWLQDKDRTEQALDGYTELHNDGYEIHVVAKNLESLSTISRAVKNALISLQGTAENGFLYERINVEQASPTIDEREVNLYRKVYYLDMNYQEE